MVLASYQAVQKGLLTQQKVNRSDTGYHAFHLRPCSKERLPSYVVYPPCFATTALLLQEHAALNTALLESERERESQRELRSKMAEQKWAVKTSVSSAEDSAV